MAEDPKVKFEPSSGDSLEEKDDGTEAEEINEEYYDNFNEYRPEELRKLSFEDVRKTEEENKKEQKSSDEGFPSSVEANGSSLSSDAKSSSGTDGEDWQERPQSPEFPPEYWQVQRLVKYIKAGNPTATVIALSALRDLNLHDKFVQMSLKESGGLEVLLNILDTDELKCKISSLLVINQISERKEITRNIFNMRVQLNKIGLQTLVNCLIDQPIKRVKLLSAQTIAKVCRLKKARRDMRRNGGIQRLVCMLDLDAKVGPYDDPPDVELARAAALALWALAKSEKNKNEIRIAGAIPLLAKLMMKKDVEVVIPVVGILQECASDPNFRTSIRTEGLLLEFVNGLQSRDLNLVQFCAKAIYMCSEDEESREFVYKMGAIDPLIKVIHSEELKKNKPLLIAATGAIWKCATSICSSSRYIERGLVEFLVALLTEEEPEEVLINVAGAIEQIAKSDVDKNASLIQRAAAIPALIKLLTHSNIEILINATRAVGELAKDSEALREMEQRDGFRFVWSLLKNPDPTVQSSAALAICPYVQSSKDSGDMVRNYVGGLEALVHLLNSENADVQSAVANAVAAIAVNNENLAIMSDHGVVQYLAKLTPMGKNGKDEFKCALSNAIAECCKWDRNSREFGRRKAVGPICAYLNSDDPLVHRAAAKALCALSTDPRNCIAIHQCGVVSYLLNMSGSLDDELRNSAAGVMHNIRNLALATERVRLL